MTAEEHRRLDDATVWLCERTSIKSIRDVLTDCHRCGLPFWASCRNANRRRYCSKACNVAACRARHPDGPRAYLDAQRARYHRRKAARRAA